MEEKHPIKLPLETERLVIRPLRIEDAADLGESEEWIREKIDRFKRDRGMSLWAAVARESGRAVALAGLQWEQIDGQRELDLGCVVANHARQRGYATEASEAIVRAAFAAGFDRLTAMTFPDNEAALHVLEKLDFMPRRRDDVRGSPVRILVGGGEGGGGGAGEGGGGGGGGRGVGGRGSGVCSPGGAPL